MRREREERMFGAGKMCKSRRFQNAKEEEIQNNDMTRNTDATDNQDSFVDDFVTAGARIASNMIMKVKIVSSCT
jgi:hypothetical protein